MSFNMKENKIDASQLRRVISLPLLILYGLGTILGAGIYILIEDVHKSV